MFVDEVIIDVTTGHGGDGCMAFRREKYIAKGGPAGGNGGRGASVILRANSKINTLFNFRHSKCFIGPDGELNVYKTTILEKPIRQAEDMIWRNVVVSKKNQRIICIDRYLSEGRTKGFVYVLQSESKRFRTLGPYHWDVSDSHNIEMAGGILEHLRQLTLRRMKNDGRYTVPASQNDYWTLIFHADSLMDDGLYAEAKQAYDLAFTEDRYILPSHLSTVAKKMMGIHKDETALDYLSHRVKMEQDFYEEPLHSTFPQLRDTFEVRQHKWGYDLAQKQYLEWIFERDQDNRMLWFLASSKRTESPERIRLQLQGLWHIFLR